MSTFKPEALTFQQGVDRIRAALQKSGMDLENTIVTSRDPAVRSLRDELRLKNLPEHFEMWQLPVTLNKALLFISIAHPNAKMPEHRHVEHAVFRLVISGSIIYNGVELTVGDWMYVPKGQSYSFEAGPLGAALLYPHGD